MTALIALKASDTTVPSLVLVPFTLMLSNVEKVSNEENSNGQYPAIGL